MSFWGVREYQMGDSLRHINWKIAARRMIAARQAQELFTNEFEQERIADVGLILDARDQTLDLSLTDRPRNTVNATLAWSDPMPGWNACLRYEYRSSQWLEDDDVRYLADGFGLWHVSVGKDFGGAVEVTLNVSNLFDDQLDNVSEWFNYYEPGRFFSLDARYRVR